MTLSEEENDANMKLSQLKLIMLHKHHNGTAGYIEEILKTEYDINSNIKSTPHLESKQPKLIGCTALHLAFMENCIEGFETLLEEGADYTIKTRGGLTVLHQILEDFYRNESMLRLDSEFATLILSAHSKNLVNPCTSYGLSHFHAACLYNNADLVKSFLESGVSVNDAVKIDASCFPGYSPLHFAVRSYGYETVQILLEKGANQNLENAEKKTPLLMLIEQKIKLMSFPDTSTMVRDSQLEDALDKHEKITHLLYNNNDCVNLSAFHLVCTMENSPLLERILENGADINSAIDQDSPLWPGFTGLHFAALCNFENMMLLLKKGANIEGRNAAGATAFDMYLNLYNPENISELLSSVDIWKDIVLSNQTTLVELTRIMSDYKEFEVFLENSDGLVSAIIPTDSVLWPGFTILHVAVQLFIADIVIVNCCLKAGADVTAQSANGSSALHLAFRKEKMELVDILLHDHFEQLSNLTDDENLSILHIACATTGHEDFVKNLLQSGADVNLAYRDKPIGTILKTGFTPLHVAVVSGNDKLVRELLEHGADRYAADSDGFTPIHWVLASPNLDKVGAELFATVDDARESIVSGLSHLHVASYVMNYQTLGNHKFTKNDEFVKQLLAMPHPCVDVAVIYEENTSPSFLSELAGATSFSLAVKKKNWCTARQLAQCGCDTLVKQANGSTLLYDTLSACEWNDGREVVSIWTSNERERRRAQEDIGLTELHLACYLTSTQEIERLLRSGENPNAQIRADSPLWPGYTPLHVLVKYHKYASSTLRELSRKLELEYDHTLTNADGDTVIHLAYMYQSGNCLYDFLRKHRNYNDNPANNAGLSYLHIACSTANLQVVDKFLSAGVDVDRSIDSFFDEVYGAGQTPLHLASNPKCTDDNSVEQSSLIVDALLRNGARVNAMDAVGQTPLHKAAEFGKAGFDVLKRIVKAGADVNALDVFCRSPWDYLLSNADFSAEQLELFIESGCRFNGLTPVDYDGYTSLMFCNCESQSEEKRILFDAILNHPRTIDTDEKGCTVVHSLVANHETSLSCDEYAKLVEQLLILSDTGCDIDDRDNEGRTALHVATYHGNHSAIEGLLIAGADINVADNDGDLAFAYLIEGDSDNESTVIARHIKKLETLTLAVNAKNRDFAASVFERLGLDEVTLRGALRAEFELAKSTEITVGSFSLSLRNFLTEIYSDKTINVSTGDPTGKLVKQFFRDFKDDRFAELRSILKLQYRKALARDGLIERASDALDRMSRCTAPCAGLIAKFLTNDELKLVIEARMIIVD